MNANDTLNQFAHDNALEGLTQHSLQALIDNQPGYSIDKAQQFLGFQKRIDAELLHHRIISNNEYCAWFEKGDISEAQLKDFVVQFSTFSNLFLIAQLKKTINADSIEGMRASKEILANEIGVVFKSSNKKPADNDQGDNPEIVSIEGSVEGGVFHFKAAHFEWLLKIAEKLGMGFNDIGKRHHGSTSTLFFCDELARLYGSEDYMTSQASSYAVENWAAAGFWNQLVSGFEKYNFLNDAELPLGFFTWHAKIEAQHAAHTQEELEELYFSRYIDEDKFIYDGNEMLEGVAAFWDGLEEHRKKLADYL